MERWQGAGVGHCVLLPAHRCCHGDLRCHMYLPAWREKSDDDDRTSTRQALEQESKQGAGVQVSPCRMES